MSIGISRRFKPYTKTKPHIHSIATQYVASASSVSLSPLLVYGVTLAATFWIKWLFYCKSISLKLYQNGRIVDMTKRAQLDDIFR